MSQLKVPEIRVSESLSVSWANGRLKACVTLSTWNGNVTYKPYYVLDRTLARLALRNFNSPLLSYLSLVPRLLSFTSFSKHAISFKKPTEREVRSDTLKLIALSRSPNTVPCLEANDREGRPFFLTKRWLQVEEKGEGADLTWELGCYIPFAGATLQNTTDCLTPLSAVYSYSAGGVEGFKGISPCRVDGHHLLVFS